MTAKPTCPHTKQLTGLVDRTLPDDHPDLQDIRHNLAVRKGQLGDLQGALSLREKVYEIRLRTLPDDHPDLQGARMNRIRWRQQSA